MIKSFQNRLAADLFDGKTSKETRKFPPELHRAARRKLLWIEAAGALHDLTTPPGNRLEALSGDLDGYWSIRINDQWRIVFRWTTENDAEAVAIVDYH